MTKEGAEHVATALALYSLLSSVLSSARDTLNSYRIKPTVLGQLRGDGIDLDRENYTVTLPNAAIPMISAMGAYLPMPVPC